MSTKKSKKRITTDHSPDKLEQENSISALTGIDPLLGESKANSDRVKMQLFKIDAVRIAIQHRNINGSGFQLIRLRKILFHGSKKFVNPTGGARELAVLVVRS